MKVLVTGASGFLGASVVVDLLAAGHDVTGLARSAPSANVIAALGADVIDGDLDDPAGLDAALRRSGADALVNLASLGFGHAPAIVAAAEDAGIARALFVSTTAIFTSLPAASRTVRVAAEETVHASTLNWTIVRPTMIYGRPGDRNLSRLLTLLRRCPVIPLPGGGRRLIQPVHVDDLSSFIVTAVDSDETVRHDYDVAGPEPLTLRDVVKTAGRAVQRRPVVLPVPLAPAVAAVSAYERLAPRPRIRREQVLRLNEDKAFDISAALSLGYAPRSFADGITQEASLLR